MFIKFEPSKLVTEVKTHLPDVTDLVFRRKAHDMGLAPGELLRDLVCECVHGAPYLELLLEHRRTVRDAQAPAQGPLQADARTTTRPPQGVSQIRSAPYGVRA